MKKNYIILTGAGFSANWGGWLASELWAVLIGNPRVQSNEKLKQFLWQHRKKGFEFIYSLLQKNADTNNNKELIEIFTDVIKEAFSEMNQHFPTYGVFNNGSYLN